jgi:NADPH:quinone reductase-like Zn-dependent oxidoreductase
MKAAIVNDYGSSEDIKIEDVAAPTLSKDNVIIKVHSSSINPYDYKIRSGMYKDSTSLKFPKILGMDLSGEISELGEDVTGYSVGDKVYGQADFFSGGGSIAEFTNAKLTSIAKMPSNLDYNEAASLPLTGVSAYQALVDKMKLAKGQKILIHGGAGGIGSLAIQLAKHIGAYVAATCSTQDKEYVLGLGADEAISYENEDFSQKLNGYDCVLDLIGGDVYKKSFLVLKENGVIVSLSAQPDKELAEKYKVIALHQFTDVNSITLKSVAELVETGDIKPQVAQVFDLSDAAKAFSMLENEHPRGKVVVSILK